MALQLGELRSESGDLQLEFPYVTVGIRKLPCLFGTSDLQLVRRLGLEVSAKRDNLFRLHIATFSCLRGECCEGLAKLLLILAFSIQLLILDSI